MEASQGAHLLTSSPVIAVIIPCFKVRAHVLDVIAKIGPYVTHIFVVDDCCPESTGDLLSGHVDKRLVVIRHSSNKGVGGAVMSGYRAALDAGADVLVKVDGDGQMDPSLILRFVEPIVAGAADYTKGNRFFFIEGLHSMPKLRLFGNAILSFMTKLSSGYWDIMDPTNGYTAIHRDVASHLPLQKISHRYFFETDMLFRLNTLGAVVLDVPMASAYGAEVSNLKIRKIVGEFLFKHVRNFAKRVFYNYYLRDMSLASIELPLGVAFFTFGTLFGSYHWWQSTSVGEWSSPGTVMLSALPVIIGIQFILAFLGHDISSVPRRPFHRRKHTSQALGVGHTVAAKYDLEIEPLKRSATASKAEP
ncbi:MAG: glycosyltransferase family 2 protein [Candidimonas sp.]|nr:glycosyltransferase family 2 protein [Candidimonas sp.]